MSGLTDDRENEPEKEPGSLSFVPLSKFRGRRNGYLLGNEVYVCPVLYDKLTDPQRRHEILARLTILDVNAYFSEAAAARMKADIAAHLIKMRGDV